MDERLLNDLLECSVCLERLDSSSKVLPCQHTFCRKCLEEIVASHQELRCPECRVLVEVRIDELPPNVLLMRILEGMKTAELNSQNTNQTTNGKPTGNRNQSHGAAPASNANAVNYQHHHHHHQHPSSGGVHGAKIGKSSTQATGDSQPALHPSHPQQQHHHHQHQPLSRIIGAGGVTGTAANNASLDLSKIPHAKAFYDFSSSETSDISFRKGDIIILKKKIDHNWCVGEVNGKEGAVPLNHIKVIVPLPFPQCKALYDFRMGPTEEEGCLTFKKGALIHVLRRVDQNWAEGRIADKIGIFPISFVEMNGLAKHMMDSSLKHILSNSNRTVPPTPFDLNASATSSSDTSSSVTTSPNSSTSTTSSNSSTAPSSPTAHFLQPQPVASSGGKQHQSKRSDPANREKRHSLTTAGLSTNTGGGALQTNQSAPHRHSTEMLNSDGAGDGKTVRQPVDSVATASSSATATTPYQKCNVTKASQMYQQHPQLPTTYIALYPYKPQKPDELELKKGSIYYVTERCQDGWFKGTNWQKKSGVFPGNYVAIHKGRDGASATSRNTSAHSSGKMNNVSSPHAAGSSASNGGCSSNGAMNSPSNGGSSSPQQQPLQLPELPPRNTTTVPQQQGMKYIDSIFGRQGSIDGGPGSPNNEQQQQQQSAAQEAGAVTTPPATGKVKKDSSAVSLMKRLTNMKRSKSPTGGGCSGGTANPAYTSDSSLFEEMAGAADAAILAAGGTPAQMAKAHFKQIANPVHVRSGSCPSQLLQNLPMDLMINGAGATHSIQQQQQNQQQQHHHQPNHPALAGVRGENVPMMYGSQRIKPHKERPSMHGFKYGDHTVVTAMPKHIAHEAPASTSSSHMVAKQQQQSHIYHRKSQSLDASAIISQLGPSQHTSATATVVATVAANGTPSKSSSKSSHSQSVRERFKCIVPYPPNSEYELELRVGDIVMVHKKRDNGWYKGTHARSGKTGLFPASFVEPDI